VSGIIALNRSINWGGRVYWQGDTITLPSIWFNCMVVTGFIVNALSANPLNSPPPVLSPTHL
jgi:hypothetical protein